MTITGRVAFYTAKVARYTALFRLCISHGEPGYAKGCRELHAIAKGALQEALAAEQRFDRFTIELATGALRETQAALGAPR